MNEEFRFVTGIFRVLEEYRNEFSVEADIKTWIYKIENGKNINGFTMLLLIPGKLTGYILVMSRLISLKS